MAWIPITEADVLTVMSGAELAALRVAALAAGQVDPVAPTSGQVIDLVRGYVGGNKRNSLGPAGSLPAKLLAPALDLLALRILSRVGKKPSDARSAAGEAAMALLEAVARGNFDIEEPLETSAEQPYSPTPAFAGRERITYRK